jgi:hypothetical protein
MGLNVSLSESYPTVLAALKLSGSVLFRLGLDLAHDR